MNSKNAWLRWLTRLLVLLFILLLGPLAQLLFGDLDFDTHWRDASQMSSEQSPLPGDLNQPIVQVYAARAFNWRGAFAVHSWIASKRRGADHYSVYQVVGWYLHHDDRSMISIGRQGPPDFFWYGSRPELLIEHRGDQVEGIIDAIEKAVASYPYPRTYHIWPGPNSNTFTAWVAREVPALKLDLPATAIGKDYLPFGKLIVPMPSGSGWQLSVNGLLGVGIAREEGFEANVLGLNFGIDVNDLAFRVPGWGRIAPFK